MKKYYCLAIISMIAIFSFQATYILNLYDHYVTEKRINIDNALHITIDKELHERVRNSKSVEAKEDRGLYIKYASEMTPEEKDSLMRLTSKGDTIHFSEARERGLGETAADLFVQLEQDYSLRKGLPINLEKLDSLFNEIATDQLEHRFLLYNQDKVVTDSVGNLTDAHPEYVSKLYPIGTKGLQYLQIKASIPVSDFIKYQLWMISLSAFFLLLVLLCIYFQLVEIRRKNKLLIKREETINGTIHDMKAPLNSVITMLSWLKMMEPDEQKKEAIEMSGIGVKSLVANIESLLVVARRDRRKLILNKTMIDIHSLVEIVIKEMDMLYQGKPHAIEIINGLPHDFSVFADSMYIENVTRNLIENSLKYSDDGVRVSVLLSVNRRMLEVSVKDNGWGIPMKYRKKIFNQFFQVPMSGEQSQKGYGIGLTQTKYIINEHGGEIKMTSVEGEGTTFTFTLPLPKM